MLLTVNPFTLAALGLCCGSIIALRLGWRGVRPGQRLLVVLGWALLPSTAVLWSMAEGVEFGISFSVALWSLLACCVIAAGAEYRRAKVPKKPAAEAAQNIQPLTATSTGQKFLTFAAAGPLALVTTCLATVVAVRLIPVDTGAQMATAVVLFPVLCALVMVWCCSGSSSGRNALALVIVGALSGTLLLI